jgi:alkanesulfonate monooxygenase SsuD/methylene tetrahydromethanopterin reductase-like flavin-dependent oxidoreductase (luciferase family)
MDSAIWAAQNDLPYATITWPLVDFEHYRNKRRLYLEAGKNAGFNVERHRCPHFLYMYCGETDGEAEDVVMEYMSRFQYIIEQHYELRRDHHQNQALMRSHTADAHPARKGTQSPEAGLEQVRISTRQVVDVHIVGDVETCRERVKAFRDEAKVDYIVLNMQFAGMPQELHSASMRRFAEKVMPVFTKSLVDA